MPEPLQVSGLGAPIPAGVGVSPVGPGAVEGPGRGALVQSARDRLRVRAAGLRVPE